MAGRFVLPEDPVPRCLHAIIVRLICPFLVLYISPENKGFSCFFSFVLSTSEVLLKYLHRIREPVHTTRQTVQT